MPRGGTRNSAQANLQRHRFEHIQVLFDIQLAKVLVSCTTKNAERQFGQEQLGESPGARRLSMDAAVNVNAYYSRTLSYESHRAVVRSRRVTPASSHASSPTVRLTAWPPLTAYIIGTLWEGAGHSLPGRYRTPHSSHLTLSEKQVCLVALKYRLHTYVCT